jgi:hypothetical protein
MATSAAASDAAEDCTSSSHISNCDNTYKEYSRVRRTWKAVRSTIRRSYQTWTSIAVRRA